MFTDDQDLVIGGWDPMKQTYRCMHCFLTAKPYLHEGAQSVRREEAVRAALQALHGWRVDTVRRVQEHGEGARRSDSQNGGSSRR